MAGLLVAAAMAGAWLMQYGWAASQGDVNSDGKVDITDLSILLSQYGSQGSADFNGNGVVDVVDLSVLLSNYGKTVTPPPSPTAPPTSGFLASYWNLVPYSGDTPPVMPHGTPTVTRNDAAIDFDWGAGSPASGINADYFAALWTGTRTFEAGSYTFTATGDDGIRVYLDNQMIIDGWKRQGPTSYATTRQMSAGAHVLKIEYYEQANGAVAKFSYAKGSVSTGPCQLSRTTPVKIMPLGDSITLGQQANGWAGKGGYRYPLWQKAAAAGWNTGSVGTMDDRNLNIPPLDANHARHEGHSGWRIEQIDASVTSWLNTHQPDVVLVMIGTNDVSQQFNLSGAPARLGHLIDTITAVRPSAYVFVASITRVSSGTYESWTQSYNSAIPGLVSQRAAAGKKVSFVNMHDDSQMTTADLADGVHPNDSGYAKMANVWYNALRPCYGN